MHNLDDVDRHLLDLLRQGRKQSATHLEEERREAQQKRVLTGRCANPGQLPDIQLDAEFERLLGGGEDLG